MAGKRHSYWRQVRYSLPLQQDEKSDKDTKKGNGEKSNNFYMVRETYLRVVRVGPFLTNTQTQSEREREQKQTKHP